MKAVDVIITDGISMLYEPQIIGKPIVFIERSDYRSFSKTGEIFSRGVHHAKNINEAQEKVEFLLENDDPLFRQQQENVAEAFPIRNAAENIVNDILNSLAQEN